MSRIPSDPELGPIETALGKLRPASGPVDRDRLMFQAGAISARADARARWVWPSIAAVLALVAASESIALATRPDRVVVVVREPAPREHTVPTGVPVEILAQAPGPAAADGDPEPWAGGEALGLPRQMLRHGLEGLPDLPPILSQSAGQTPGPAGEPSSNETLRRLEVEKLLNPGGPS